MQTGNMNVTGSENGCGIRIRHNEYWGSISIPASSSASTGQLVMDVGKSGIPVLDTLAASFERYRIHNCVVRYNPSVGTTRDGAAVIGISWDPAKTFTTMSSVSSLNPNRRTAVWQPSVMKVPPERIMMSRKWLYTTTSQSSDVDKAAFALAYSVTALNVSTTAALPVADVWISYDVELQGPLGN